MSFGSAKDLATMLRGAGVAAVYNGVTTYGILDVGSSLEPTDDGGMAQKIVTTFLCAADAFTDLRIGGRIVVDRYPYIIHPPIAPEDDGELIRIPLVRTT